MRSVAAHHGPLVQCFIHKMNLPAGQVADAAVHQLGSAARSRLREVPGFHQRCAEAAGHCINRDAQTGRTTANYQDIEVVRQGRKGLLSVHNDEPTRSLASASACNSIRRARLRAGRNWWMRSWYAPPPTMPPTSGPRIGTHQ